MKLNKVNWVVVIVFLIGVLVITVILVNTVLAPKKVLADDVIASLEGSGLEKQVCFEDGHCERALDYFGEKLESGNHTLKIKGIFSMKRNFGDYPIPPSSGEMYPSFFAAGFWISAPTEHVGDDWTFFNISATYLDGKNISYIAEFNPYPNITEWIGFSMPYVRATNFVEVLYEKD